MASRRSHVACRVGTPRCVDALLKAGADVDKATPDGELPLHTVCKAVSPATDSPRTTPRSHRKCFRLLIDGGAKIDAKFKNRRPIHYAHQANADDLVQTLLAAGAKPLPAPKKKVDPGKKSSSSGPPVIIKKPKPSKKEGGKKKPKL